MTRFRPCLLGLVWMFTKCYEMKALQIVEKSYQSEYANHTLVKRESVFSIVEWY